MLKQVCITINIKIIITIECISIIDLPTIVSCTNPIVIGIVIVNISNRFGKRNKITVKIDTTIYCCID